MPTMTKVNSLAWLRYNVNRYGINYKHRVIRGGSRNNGPWSGERGARVCNGVWMQSTQCPEPLVGVQPPGAERHLSIFVKTGGQKLKFKRKRDRLLLEAMTSPYFWSRGGGDRPVCRCPDPPI